MRSPSDVAKSEWSGLPIGDGGTDRAPPDVLSRPAGPGAEADVNFHHAAQLRELADALDRAPGDPAVLVAIGRALRAVWQLPDPPSFDEVRQQALARAVEDFDQFKLTGGLADPWPALRRALRQVARTLPSRGADLTDAFFFVRNRKFATHLATICIAALEEPVAA